MRQPFVAPTSMYSMKRSVTPRAAEVPRELDDLVLVDAALDDAVDLDRHPDRLRGLDALEHARDGEVDVVHRLEDRVVERVEADGDALRGPRP